jgi:hypothetical protein
VVWPGAGATATANIAVLEVCPAESLTLTDTVSGPGSAKLWLCAGMLPASLAPKLVTALPSPQLTLTVYGPVASVSAKLPSENDVAVPAVAICPAAAVVAMVTGGAATAALKVAVLDVWPAESVTTTATVSDPAEP